MAIQFPEAATVQVVTDDSVAKRWTKFGALTVLTLLLWWAGIDWPNGLQRGLEPSWEAALVQAHVQGWQFGDEIQFTYGPWGFLSLAFFSADALDIKLGWEVFGRLALALTVVLLSAGLTKSVRWVFLLASVLTAVWFEESARLLITILVIIWLIPLETKIWQRALAVAWLSFLAHHKFVFCVEATAGVGLAAAVALVHRRWRSAGALLGGYGVAYLGWWIAAGQRVGNLPSFWRLSWEISDGYGWSMGIDPTDGQLVAGLIVAAMAIAVLWQVTRGSLPWAQRIGTVLMLTGGWLLAWKQAFTRADMHMFGFFLYSFLMAIVLLGRSLAGRGYLYSCAALIVVAPLATLPMGSDVMAPGPRAAWSRVTQRPRELVHLGEFRERFVQAEAAVARGGGEVDVKLRSLVGRATIDGFTYEQGMILVNGLNYRPRPVMQSYSAYTQALLELNARFMRSERAPEFAVVRLDTIDNRLWTQDDSLSLLELARRYELVAKMPDYILMQRSALPRTPSERSDNVLASHVPQFGDEVKLPEPNGHPLWIEIESRPTLLGRLRSFFYHAAELRMVATSDDARTRDYRILPGACRSGFFIRPWMRDHEDFAAFLGGETRAERVRSIRFEFVDPHDSWFWRRPRVRFSSVPEFAVR